MNPQERHIEVWNDCLRIIEQNVEPQQFKVWFRPIRAVSLQDSKLTVEVPSLFFQEYVESAFLDIIRKTLIRVVGEDAQLSYMVRPVTNQPEMRFSGQRATTPVNPQVTINTTPTANPSPFIYPGLQKVQINPRLNRKSNLPTPKIMTGKAVPLTSWTLPTSPRRWICWKSELPRARKVSTIFKPS